MPPIHHQHIVSDLGNERQVVRDEDDGHIGGPADLGEQIDDLLLHRYVECSGRFVGDDHIGTAGDGHGDDHALFLSAGDLVRIGIVDALGIGQFDLFEELEHFGLALGGAHPGMDLEHFLDLRTAALHGVERTHGFLKDHRDAFAPQTAEMFLGQGGQVYHPVALAEKHFAAAHPQVGIEQAGNGIARDGLSRLPDDTQHLPFFEGKADVLHQRPLLAVLDRADAQIVYFQYILFVHHVRIHVSKAQN